MDRARVLSLLLPKTLRSAVAAVDFERAGLLDGLSRDERRSRVELLEHLATEGVSIEEMAEAGTQDRLGLLLLERTLAPHGEYTLFEVADRVRADPDKLRRWLRAIGRPCSDDNARIHGEADVALAERMLLFQAIGLPEDSLLIAARAFGRGLTNMADAAGALLGEALLEADPDPDTALALAGQARRMAETDAYLLTHILSVNLADRIRSHAVAAVEQRAGRMQGAQDVTVCFADLVGFTSLGEEISVEQLGEVAEALTAAATDVAEPPVRLVKTIGDAVMLVSPDPLAMVRTALALCDSLDLVGDQIPGVRIGMASGIGVPYGGDWYGPPVNLASRITSVARPGGVLASSEVRYAAVADDLHWREAGNKRFRGVRGAQRLYRVRREAD